MLTLADVYEGLVGFRPSGTERIAITDVVVDSRKAQPGALFVALKGDRHDGHDFIKEALEHGAAAVIAEERVQGLGLGSDVHMIPADAAGGAAPNLQQEVGAPPGLEPLVPIVFVAKSSLAALQRVAGFWRCRFNCRVIGITGSVGKSSTKELVAAVLRQRFETLKSIGNLNNEIGLPLTLLKLNERHRYAVLEMGTYALGEIQRLCEIAQPSVGIVTKVGPSHLERLGTIDRIAQAKAELVQALPDEGIAILNGDDPYVRPMQEKTRARAFLYGLEPQNDLWADSIESDGLEGIAFDLHRAEEKLHVHVPLLGRHSVQTALAAASVGLVEEMPWYDILNGLQDVSAQLRLIAVHGEKGTTLLDDTYNASPDSSLAALNLLAELSGRKVAVLGDMLELGAIEEQGHRVVGGRAAEVVQVLIAVGSRGKWIGEAAQEAGLRDTYWAEDNEQALEVLRDVIQAGDMILVKGSRGAKMEEIVAALARPVENGTAEGNGWLGP